MEEAAYLKGIFNAFKESMGKDTINTNGNDGISNRIKKEILPALEYLVDCSRLLDKGPLTLEQRTYINGMRQICHLLLEKVRNPSSNTKAIASVKVAKELDFNLHHLLQNVSYISNTLAVSPTLKIHLEIDRAIPEVIKGDPSLLSHILIQLLGIGIDYMENGSLSLRVSSVRESKYVYSLEFEFTLHNGNSQNTEVEDPAKKSELPFRAFQKWMAKHDFPSEFLWTSELEQTIKFILPFQRAGNMGKKSDKLASGRANPALDGERSNWDSLLLQCKGDLKILEERLNLWQGQLLGFIGRAKIQLKNADFTGLEKSSLETRKNLSGIPFHDIDSLLERIGRTCATDKEMGHLRFLYKSLLEEYNNMDRAIVSELKRLEREGGL